MWYKLCERLWQNIKKNCSLDSRSIALFRMSLAVVIVYNVCVYLYWSTPFLSPHGLLPLHEVQHGFHGWSVFAIYDALWFQRLLLLCTGLLAVCLFLGVQTRFVVLLLLLLHLSQEERLYVTGKTIEIRLALLWALFLPLSQSWSFSFAHSVRKHTSVRSGGTIAFTLQIVMLYLFAASFKQSADWTQNFSAAYKSLWNGGMVTNFGEWLRQHTWLTIFLTKATFCIEWFSPLALIAPFYQPYLRYIGVVSLMTILAGFQMSLNISPFTYANIAMLFAVIPSEFWQKFTKHTSALPLHPKASFVQNSLPLLIIFIFFWQNLWYSHSAPPLPKVVYSALEITRYLHRWDMFARSDHTYRFWPYVRGVTYSQKILDPYAWYIGLSPVFTPEPEPSVSSDLTPGFRWEKYITNITMNRRQYSAYHRYFLQFLCAEYNRKHSDPLKEVTLGFGHQEVMDFYTFGPIITRDLSTIQCAQTGQVE